MRVGLSRVSVALGLVAIVGLAGCAGQSWKMPTFWKKTSSAPAPAPSAPAPARSAPAPTEPAPPASPAPAPVPVTPPPAQEATVASAAPAPSGPPSSGLAEIPEITDVHFGPGRITVLKADSKVLDDLARWLKDNPMSRIVVEGHTDDLGPRDKNLAISEQRARSVKHYLVSSGVEPERIAVTSFGSDRPICTEKTSECRAKNRRVRFLVGQP